MKKSIFILPLLALTLACSEEDMYVEPMDEVGQMSQVPVDAATTDQIFMVVEKSATFLGGQQAWGEYLKNNLKYPEKAIAQGIEGSVYLSFVTDENGVLSDIKVSRGIGGGCDQEAIRMIQESPNWSPAEQRGRAVKARMAIRVVFKLGSATASSSSEVNPIRVSIPDGNKKVINLSVEPSNK